MNVFSLEVRRETLIYVHGARFVFDVSTIRIR